MSLSQLYIPITVDLSNPYPLPLVHAQQNNIGRGARVTLTNGGTVISPANVTAVTSWATKPDKTVSYLECEVENDQIVLVFTSQMLAVPGDLQVELQLIGDGFNITTPIFLVKVGKSNISEDAILSENELSFVEQLMEVGERLQEDADSGVFDGVGVASVVQTTTSTADDGNNVVTVTLTDGSTSTFTVQNGSKGSTGATGAAGTSVTITSVSESSADGGSNVVTFSDGTTMTVKNGSKGSTGTVTAANIASALGYTPADQADVDSLSEEIDDHTADTTSHVTSTEKSTWNAKSDFSGAYSDLTGKPTIPTKTSQLTNDSGFLTAHQDISGKLDKNQGSANVGKILVVGTDGNLTLTDMPEVTSDVVGTIDESNNILLVGNLADGTYTLKYENEDGTYTEVGSLVVGAVVEEETRTNFANPTSDEWQTGYRLTTDAYQYKALTGSIVTNFVDIESGDIIYIEGINFVDTGNRNAIVMDDSQYTYILAVASTFIATAGFSDGSYDSDSMQFTFTYDSTDMKARFSGVATGTSEDVVINIMRNGEWL